VIGYVPFLFKVSAISDSLALPFHAISAVIGMLIVGGFLVKSICAV
jgi:hypothetical protein